MKFEGKSGFDYVDAVSKIRNMVLERKPLLMFSDVNERVFVVKKMPFENLWQKYFNVFC